MKRASNEKEYRALTLSRRRSSINSVSNSSNNAVANLPQPITARDMGSRKVDIKDNPDKRRLQGSNNFVALTQSAPE
jgi:hypothetical protein